ncbi:MAG: hypothetical protein COA99_02350 [Moraxellaceae bacterium]|nr:MAG: hypothetical protein COA99_02350 [Moraxellaceae bacterium]
MGGGLEPREAVDPYLGVWERPCVPYDEHGSTGIFGDVLDLYSAPALDDVGPFFYWTEKLTIEPNNIILEFSLFTDDQCQELGDTSGLFGGFTDYIFQQMYAEFSVGGEILAKNELVSDEELSFIQYEAPVGRSTHYDELYLNVRNVGDRLYKVETSHHALEDYTVNFDKYYIRTQN